MSNLEKIKQLEQRVISLEKELKDFKEFIEMDIKCNYFKFQELEEMDHKILDLIEEITSKDAKWIKKAGIEQNE
jgi:hypothetical protein